MKNIALIVKSIILSQLVVPVSFSLIGLLTYLMLRAVPDSAMGITGLVMISTSFGMVASVTSCVFLGLPLLLLLHYRSSLSFWSIMFTAAVTSLPVALYNASFVLLLFSVPMSLLGGFVVWSYLRRKGALTSTASRTATPWPPLP